MHTQHREAGLITFAEIPYTDIIMHDIVHSWALEVFFNVFNNKK